MVAGEIVAGAYFLGVILGAICSGLFYEIYMSKRLDEIHKLYNDAFDFIEKNRNALK